MLPDAASWGDGQGLHLGVHIGFELEVLTLEIGGSLVCFKVEVSVLSRPLVEEGLQEGPQTEIIQIMASVTQFLLLNWDPFFLQYVQLDIQDRLAVYLELPFCLSVVVPNIHRPRAIWENPNKPKNNFALQICQLHCPLPHMGP